MIEAFLEFFHMSDTSQQPSKNTPNMAFMTTDQQKRQYIENTLDKFLDQFILTSEDEDPFGNDGVAHYAVNLLKSFMLLVNFKDAVASGNGQYLSVLHKLLLINFYSAAYNEYAIEMLINIMQTEILLSPAEAHRCMWAATVNWRGGAKKNVEIDLFQEVRNKDMKTMVKSMGANKTEKAIQRASKAAGGVRKIVEAFEKQVAIHQKSSQHSHQASDRDEMLIGQDLRSLRPFQQVEGRKFQAFRGISHNPTSSLNEAKFVLWINNHKKNILMHFPSIPEEIEEIEEMQIGETESEGLSDT